MNDTMTNEPKQSLEHYVQELADREEPYSSQIIKSLKNPGSALYVLVRAERAQVGNFAPAFITFGYVIATENKVAAVNPDDIIDLIRERYKDDAEDIVADFERAMIEL